MNKDLRVGLVGCGVIAQRTLPGVSAILSERRAVVTALCDPSSAAMDSVAAMLAGDNEISRFEALDGLLDANCCDAILLASPIGLHFEQVRSALDRGLHVYSHKTLAGTRAECEALGEMADSAGLRLAASPGQILLPAYQRAAELIRDGELGDIVTVDAAAEAAPHRYEAERSDEDPAEGARYSWEWYHRKEAGGGPLDDMFVYPLAFLTEVFGELVDATIVAQLLAPRIEWHGRVIEATAPDSYCGILRFGDATATMRSSFGSNTQFIPWGTIVVRGTRAALEIIKHNDQDYSLFVARNASAATEEKLPVFGGTERQALGTAECHVLVDIREFIDAIVEQRPVRGATASNAARTVGALRMIQDRATGA